MAQNHSRLQCLWVCHNLRMMQLWLYVIHSVHTNNGPHGFNLTHFIGKHLQSRFRQNFVQTYILGIIFIYAQQDVLASLIQSLNHIKHLAWQYIHSGNGAVNTQSAQGLRCGFIYSCLCTKRIKWTEVKIGCFHHNVSVPSTKWLY